MLEGTLGASLLGNLLTGKGTTRTGEITIRAGEGTIRAYNEYLKNTGIWFNNVWIFCIGFIAFMLKCKNVLKYINLFSAIDYEKNDKTILKYFQ